MEGTEEMMANILKIFDMSRHNKEMQNYIIDLTKRCLLIFPPLIFTLLEEIENNGGY